MKIKIVIADGNGTLIDERWTDESAEAIIGMLETYLSCYGSEEELDEANEPEEGDEDDNDG